MGVGWPCPLLIFRGACGTVRASVWRSQTKQASRMKAAGTARGCAGEAICWAGVQGAAALTLCAGFVRASSAAAWVSAVRQPPVVGARNHAGRESGVRSRRDTSGDRSRVRRRSDLLGGGTGGARVRLWAGDGRGRARVRATRTPLIKINSLHGTPAGAAGRARALTCGVWDDARGLSVEWEWE